MKPRFLTQMEEAFAVRQHVILSLNTEDRFYFPEEEIGPSNLNYFLATYFSRKGYRVAQYAPSMGVRELSPSGNISRHVEQLSRENDPIEVLNGLTSLLRSSQEQWIIMVLHAERIAPPPEAGTTVSKEGVAFAEILHTLALDDGIAEGPSRLVLVTYSGMPEELLVRSRGYRLIEVGLPDESERKAFIEFLDDLSARYNEFGHLEDGLSREEVARLTSGMPLSGIEAMYRSSGHFKRPISREQIRLTKAREIRNLARDLLEVSEPEEGFEEVAGLWSVKAYFKHLIPQIKAGLPGVPQAFLLQGVPGCGKSHLVKALSCELGWPLLELRNVRSPFVGQSEMNLEHVIRVVEQLQPAILFFDEIDQSLGQRGTGVSGDSGTSERLLARIFAWLGSLHLRGRVLFVGATNRPDLLDPALLDRFGVSIPFLKPGYEELQDLIPILLKRFGRKLKDFDTEEAAQLLKEHSLTGRAIQEILIDAGLYADHETGGMMSEIQKEHLEKAIINHIPREDKVEIEFITLVSLSLCSLQSLLPWNDFEGKRSDSEIPDYLIEMGVVDRDGRLLRDSLDKVISEIKQRRHMERIMR